MAGQQIAQYTDVNSGDFVKIKNNSNDCNYTGYTLIDAIFQLMICIIIILVLLYTVSLIRQNMINKYSN